MRLWLPLGSSFRPSSLNTQCPCVSQCDPQLAAEQTHPGIQTAPDTLLICKMAGHQPHEGQTPSSTCETTQRPSQSLKQTEREPPQVQRPACRCSHYPGGGPQDHLLLQLSRQMFPLIKSNLMQALQNSEAASERSRKELCD